MRFESITVEWDVDTPMDPTEAPQRTRKNETGERKLSRKEIRDMLVDRPLWTPYDDPFRPAVCRPESSRRFALLAERHREQPDYDRVRVRGVPIQIRPGMSERRSSLISGEHGSAA